MTTTGPASPQLDGRIGWGGTLAQLRAQFPASRVPIGTRSETTDFGPVIAANGTTNGIDWYGEDLIVLPTT